MFYIVTSLFIAFYYTFISLLSFFFFFVPIFSVPSLAVSHVSGYGVVAWWRAVGANKEKEDVCRMGGKSADEESGVCGQLHA